MVLETWSAQQVSPSSFYHFPGPSLLLCHIAIGHKSRAGRPSQTWEKRVHPRGRSYIVALFAVRMELVQARPYRRGNPAVGPEPVRSTQLKFTERETPPPTPLPPHMVPTPRALSRAFLSVFLRYPISHIITSTPASSPHHGPLMGAQLHPKTSSSTVKPCGTQVAGGPLRRLDPSYSHSKGYSTALPLCPVSRHVSIHF